MLENNKIDIVLPYAGICAKDVLPYIDNDEDYISLLKRFNYGEEIFRLALRGISENMKFIDTLHLIVSDMTKIPDWLNLNSVHLINVKDMLQDDLEYNFNSNNIEMTLGRLDCLAPRFIYLCDDYIVCKPIQESDIFNGENIKYKYHNKSFNVTNLFSYSIKNDIDLIKEYFNLSTYEKNPIVHQIFPFVTSRVKEVYNIFHDEIVDRMTVFRRPNNINQFIYTMYDDINGYVELSNLNVSYTEGKWDERFRNAHLITLNNIDDGHPIISKIKNVFEFLNKKSKFEI